MPAFAFAHSLRSPFLVSCLVSFLALSPRLLLEGAPLIAIHKARYYKRKVGLALGPGPFVAGLEYATDVTATVVGKPAQTFFLEALRGTNCAPEETVMIGDVSAPSLGVPFLQYVGETPAHAG